jgi:hypothetical protein
VSPVIDANSIPPASVQSWRRRPDRGRHIDLTENAVSVAGVLLLTEATLTAVEEPKPEAREPVGVA